MKLPLIVRKTLYTAKVLIPFYFLYRMHVDSDKNKYNQNSDKQSRVGIRGVSIVLTLMVGAITPSLLLPGAMGTLLSIAGVTILPSLVDILVKQLIRGFSYLQNYKNDDIINKTYPQKYQPYDINDKVTHHAMQALYQYKQKLKNEPAGYWGDLSEDQKEQCELINKAIKIFRHKPIDALFNVPTTSPFGSSDKERGSNGPLKESYIKLWADMHARSTGIPLDKHDFLRKIIDSPSGINM